jgi:hypothetical protein
VATFFLFVVIATASPVVLAPGYGEPDPDEPDDVDDVDVTAPDGTAA